MKCTVKGCHNYHALGAKKDHDLQYQESHQVLLSNEVERLRGVLFDKVRETLCIECKEITRLFRECLGILKQISMDFKICQNVSFVDYYRLSRPIEAVNKYKAIYEGYFNYFLG